MKICPSCSELYPDGGAFCTACGAPLVKTLDRLLGRTIAARYRLIRRLGSGGMSLVYLARHVMIERLSALKILRRDLGLDPQHRERFLREARAVNRINHPNIVEITDYGESDDMAYLVMEYVAGDSVLGHMQRGVFPWPRAVRIALQVSSALARAHQLGVIHRDLKPENVLVVARPEGDLVKLTDFGIAKILDAPALTFAEQMFGTPGYIAPEYIEGSPPDGRADLYALGVLLYEMMTGVLPYDARAEADLLLQPLTSSPIPPSQRIAGLPPDLETLILSLLARRPHDRPRDAFVAHDALADILRRFGPGSMRPPPDDGSRSLQGALAPASAPMPRAPEPTAVSETSRPDVPRAAALDSSKLTRDVQKNPTLQMASRWSAALIELDLILERTRARGPSHRAAAERATALAETARELVARIDRVARLVSEHQARADRIEAKGREFRANLGHALDVLVHDRSRERAHADAIARGREALRDAGASKLAVSRRTGDTRVWEGAALEQEEARARAVETDLTFQIAALQTELDRRNEDLDDELVEAAGALEGALSAHRRLTSELVKTLDEATSLVAAEPSLR